MAGTGSPGPPEAVPDNIRHLLNAPNRVTKRMDDYIKLYELHVNLLHELELWF